LCTKQSGCQLEQSNEKRNFDISLISKAFLLGALQDQDETLRQLQNPFRDSKAVRELVQEVVDHARLNNCTPVQVIGLGLMYGMATGIFIEQERASRRKHGFDVSTVVREFLDNKYPQRRDLIAMFTAAFRDNPILVKLQIRVGQEVVHHANSPVQTMAISLRYGMCVGIMLERDRVARATTILIPQ
jgi:hypothetical protein